MVRVAKSRVSNGDGGIAGVVRYIEDMGGVINDFSVLNDFNLGIIDEVDPHKRTYWMKRALACPFGTSIISHASGAFPSSVSAYKFVEAGGPEFKICAPKYISGYPNLNWSPDINQKLLIDTRSLHEQEQNREDIRLHFREMCKTAFGYTLRPSAMTFSVWANTNGGYILETSNAKNVDSIMISTNDKQGGNYKLRLASTPHPQAPNGIDIAFGYVPVYDLLTPKRKKKIDKLFDIIENLNYSYKDLETLCGEHVAVRYSTVMRAVIHDILDGIPNTGNDRIKMCYKIYSHAVNNITSIAEISETGKYFYTGE